MVCSFHLFIIFFCVSIFLFQLNIFHYIFNTLFNFVLNFIVFFIVFSLVSFSHIIQLFANRNSFFDIRRSFLIIGRFIIFIAISGFWNFIIIDNFFILGGTFRSLVSLRVLLIFILVFVICDSLRFFGNLRLFSRSTSIFRWLHFFGRFLRRFWMFFIFFGPFDKVIF